MFKWGPSSCAKSMVQQLAPSSARYSATYAQQATKSSGSVSMDNGTPVTTSSWKGMWTTGLSSSLLHPQVTRRPHWRHCSRLTIALEQVRGAFRVPRLRHRCWRQVHLLQNPYKNLADKRTTHCWKPLHPPIRSSVTVSPCHQVRVSGQGSTDGTGSTSQHLFVRRLQVS